MKWPKTLLLGNKPSKEVSEEREDRFEEKIIKAMNEEGFDSNKQGRILKKYRDLRADGYVQMDAIEKAYDADRWRWIRWTLLIAILAIVAYFLVLPMIIKKAFPPSEPFVPQIISEEQKTPEPEKTPDQICQAKNIDSYAQKALNQQNGDFNFDAKRPFGADEDARSIAKQWLNDTIGMDDTLLISITKDINNMYMNTSKPTGADIEISALLKSQDPLFVDGCATDKTMKLKGYIAYLLNDPDLTSINMVEIKKLSYDVKSLYVKDNSIYVPVRYGVSGDISDYLVEIVFRDKPTITATGEKKPGKIIGRRGIDPNCHNWLKETHREKKKDSDKNDKKDKPKCDDDEVYDNGKCLNKKTGEYREPEKKPKIGITDQLEIFPTEVVTQETNNDIVDNAGVNSGSETGGLADGANSGSTSSDQINEGGGTIDGEITD